MQLQPETTLRRRRRQRNAGLRLWVVQRNVASANEVPELSRELPLQEQILQRSPINVLKRDCDSGIGHVRAHLDGLHQVLALLHCWLGSSVRVVQSIANEPLIAVSTVWPEISSIPVVSIEPVVLWSLWIRGERNLQSLIHKVPNETTLDCGVLWVIEDLVEEVQTTVAVAHRMAVFTHDQRTFVSLGNVNASFRVCIHRADNICCWMLAIAHDQGCISVSTATFELNESSVVTEPQPIC
mmetsp:Transcript_73508/g.153373  ORF Transcript_73508/g.153373 Transcript_73508/m.153373 type:complete len:240 (+) Transcript_73508:1515-2234(+)